VEKDHIEAEDLKAKGVFEVIWLARAIDMLEVRLDRDDGLSDDILDLDPELVRILLGLMLSYMFKDGS
jgi:hypothetical protein